MSAQKALYRVKLRRDAEHVVKPNAEQLNGNVYRFWYSGACCDTPLYGDELMMVPCDPSYPEDAPTWVSLEDLELVQQETKP